jgi:hypothetical protein
MKLFFQSEETGYSHLYTYNLKSKENTADQRKWEVRNVSLSKDKSLFNHNDYPSGKQKLL